MKNGRWILLLLAATLIWGSTFVLVKDTLKTFPTFSQNAMRMGLATLVIGAYILLSRIKVRKQDLKRGALLGIFLFIGYSAQTLGLNFTSATNSAFITGLLVIFVPLLSAFMLRKPPERKIWLAVCLALIGLYFLTGVGGSTNIGDWITLACSVFFSFHIIYTGKWANTSDPFVLLLSQFALAAVLSAIFMVGLGEIPASYPLPALGIIIFLTLAASVFAQWAQIKAQAKIDVSRISIILLFEPISAAFFGFVFLGEMFTAAKIAGAFLILAAMVLAEHEGIRI